MCNLSIYTLIFPTQLLSIYTLIFPTQLLRDRVLSPDCHPQHVGLKNGRKDRRGRREEMKGGKTEGRERRKEEKGEKKEGRKERGRE